MSKKTPKNEKAKTKSARNQSNARLAVFNQRFIVLAGIFFIFFVVLFWYRNETVETCVQIDQECFELEVADNESEQTKGLSDRDNLAQDKGMLFVFDQAAERCFWMKEVRFNLDIIWTDGQKKITKIKENVSPDTYPRSFCEDNSQYVLEFNQGFVAKYGLKTGTKLQF